MTRKAKSLPLERVLHSGGLLHFKHYTNKYYIFVAVCDGRKIVFNSLVISVSNPAEYDILV